MDCFVILRVPRNDGKDFFGFFSLFHSSHDAGGGMYFAGGVIGMNVFWIATLRSQ
jgi:hypothetical protein